MALALTSFTELEQPVDMGSFGYYVGCIHPSYDEYYLHDDCDVYHTCAARYDDSRYQISTGWFKTGIEAYIHSQIYYNNHGLKYPFANKITTGAAVADTTESQVMEFL